MMATEASAGCKLEEKTKSGKPRRQETQLYVPPRRESGNPSTTSATARHEQPRSEGTRPVSGTGGRGGRYRNRGGRGRGGRKQDEPASIVDPGNEQVTQSPATTKSHRKAVQRDQKQPGTAAGQGRRDGQRQRGPSARGGKKRGKPRNTESFVPDHSPPDMRVVIGPNAKQFGRPYNVHDVVVVPELFAPLDDRDTVRKTPSSAHNLPPLLA